MAFVRQLDLVGKVAEILSSVRQDDMLFIYPFGEKGRAVKKILDLCNREAIIVDNKLKMDGVITLDQIRNMGGGSRQIVLLCSDSEIYYNELRTRLYEFIPPEQVIDIFSFSLSKDTKGYWAPVHYDNDRVAALELAAREIYMNKVEGDVAECGVYQGEFSKYIARFLPDRTLYLFDTFSGFDNRDLINDKLYADMPKFNDTSVEKVLDNIGSAANVVVRKGWFPETTKGLEDRKYAFVSLDTDLYDPILEGLKYFWPRLSSGGYIFVHDFGGLKGVNRAVMEFCKQEHISYVRLPDYATSAILQKPL